MTWWRLSTRRWTVCVATDSEDPFIIRQAPPYVAALRGRPLRELIRWARHDPEWKLLRLP